MRFRIAVKLSTDPAFIKLKLKSVIVDRGSFSPILFTSSSPPFHFKEVF